MLGQRDGDVHLRGQPNRSTGRRLKNAKAWHAARAADTGKHFWPFSWSCLSGQVLPVSGAAKDFRMNAKPLCADQRESFFFVRVVVSKKRKLVTILECYSRAVEARRMADTTTDPSAKADLLKIEKRWLAQARNIRAKLSKRPPAKTRTRKK